MTPIEHPLIRQAVAQAIRHDGEDTEVPLAHFREFTRHIANLYQDQVHEESGR